MRVEQVFWPSVIWITPDQPLQKAAWRMREFDISCVVVLEDGALVGVVTDHDLLRAAADGIDPKAVRVSDYMTTRPVTIDASAEVAEAASAMIKAHARHLPVLKGGLLAVMVSARDVLVEAADPR